MTDQMDYRKAYLDIAIVVCKRFPPCEITTVDMVRLLAHENDTLRMALGIPHFSKVLAETEEE
jgi:hypothetical protein